MPRWYDIVQVKPNFEGEVTMQAMGNCLQSRPHPDPKGAATWESNHCDTSITYAYTV